MTVREVIRPAHSIASVREALEFHFEGLRLEGLAVPQPSVQAAVVEVA